jgi:hypothetical protein
LDGGAITVALAVFPLAAVSLRTDVKPCSTSVYMPYRALYSYFPFRSWWRFLLVSTMFRTIRVHLKLSPTDAGVHFTKQAMAMSTLHTRSMKTSVLGCCCMVSPYSNLRDSVRFG